MKKTHSINIVRACGIVMLGAVLLVTSLVTSCQKRRENGEQSNDVHSPSTETAAEHINILFLGLDREAALCDVIMLASIDKGTGDVTVAQIPRDTYAEYTERDYKKLNGAYNSLGGAAQTARFLSGVLGVEIHHSVCMGLDTLGDIVDAVGGVDLYLSEDMKYSDAEQGLYINLKSGYNHLDGKTAEHFIRFRSGYSDGDIGRLNAQKLFAAALFDKLANNLSLVEKIKTLAALDGIETDMSRDEIFALASEMLHAKGEKYMLTLPGSEATATKSGASYFVVSASSTAEVMKVHFGADDEFDKDALLLNSSYESFEKIYKQHIECTKIPLNRLISAAKGENMQ